MGEVGCYSLDLYCDDPDHPWPSDPIQYIGQTVAEARREAREDGWLWRAGPMHLAKTICPGCAQRAQGGE